MASTPAVTTTARPRAGRRFEPVHERELERDTLEAARTLPGAHRGLLVLKEMAGPFGVPDLLVAVGPPGLLEARQALDVPPLLNQVDAGVVAATAVSAPRKPESIARRLSWPADSVRRRLPELVRVGALTRVGGDTYVRPDALVPVARLYAIEAKLKNWRRAVRQVRTYGVWCDGYVIVTAALGDASLSGLLTDVEADRGGLMVAGKWLRRPRLANRSPAQRLWGSEHLVAATRGIALRSDDQ